MHVHNKTIFRALAAVAVTASYAQSNVEIYGGMDLGYVQSTGTAIGAKSGSELGFSTPSGGVTSSDYKAEDKKTKASSWGNQNARYTSRLGFRGTEDLGGGLRAGFAYEVALAPDNNGNFAGTSIKDIEAQNRVGFGTTRLANLSLSGGFGTVVLGTFMNQFNTVRGYSAASAGVAGGDFLLRHNTSQTNSGTVGASYVNAANSALGVIAVNSISKTATKLQTTALLSANVTAGFDTIAFADEDGAATVVAADRAFLTVTDVPGTNSVEAQAHDAKVAKFVKDANNDLILLEIVGEMDLNGIGFNSRSTNSVAYSSPNFGGFNFGVGFVNDKTDRRPEQAADTRTVSGYMLSANYAAGPLKASAVMGRGKSTFLNEVKKQANSELKNAGWGIAASYDLGVAVPYVQHETANLKFGSLGADTKADSKAITKLLGSTKIETAATEVGVRFPMGAFTPYVAVGTGSYEVKGAFKTLGDVKFKSNSYQLGTTYDLSKRTSMYASMGQNKQKYLGQTTAKDSSFAAGLIHTF